MAVSPNAMNPGITTVFWNVLAPDVPMAIIAPLWEAPHNGCYDNASGHGECACTDSTV